jgi:hypothetical protein
MAKVISSTKVLVVTVSKLVKDDSKEEVRISSESVQECIDQIARHFEGDGLITEVEVVEDEE